MTLLREANLSQGRWLHVPRRRAAPLLDHRHAERDRLDRLMAAVRAGQSQCLVLRGEPGVGKSALLEYLVEQAAGCRVARAAGVRSEMGLPYAAVHQLCAPMLERLDRLPEPQHDALRAAFGLRAGPPPDRFLVGLAVLTLLAEVADDRPLVCVIEDAQWLDSTSAQVLAFVTRRLSTESVACVFAARSDATHDLSGLPELVVGGLRDEDARALLRSVVPGPLDRQVRDRIVAEAHGNPLALLEFADGMTPAALAGGFGLPAAQPPPGGTEDSFRRRLESLPPDARWLLLVAAAEPLGDPVLVWRAAAGLGVGAAAPAAAGELCEFGARVRFCHPLARSAAYLAAVPEERRRAHHALAEATDAADPDRRAWHRAHATAGADEEVAAELERSAGRALARGGLAAVAAILQRATELTPEPGRRAGRALAAARAKKEAGAPEAASGLLGVALAGPLDERQRAYAALLHAEIAFTANRGNAAPPLLLDAARQLRALDPDLSRDTYLEAMSAAMFAGRLAVGGGGLSDIAACAARAVGLRDAAVRARAVGLRDVAVRAALEPGRAVGLRDAAVRATQDLLLDGLVSLFTADPGAAAPVLRRAVAAFLGHGAELRQFWLVSNAAVALWDGDAWRTLADRHVALARDTGALAEMPLALSSRVMVHLFEGELAEAASLSAEVQAITTATGLRIINHGALALAAWRGREAEAEELMRISSSEAASRGEGAGMTVTDWARAVLYNGLGRYDQARAAAQRASADPPTPGAAAQWAPAELVEAATRSGDRALALRAARQLAETARVSPTEWALGIEARTRALVSEPATAENLYREAIDRLGRTRLRPDLARAHLLYGEWLRRERRRIEARQQLRTAHRLFTTIGMAAFAERAARELRATGETAQRRNVPTGGDLTPREGQIAQLATKGLTNSEIGSRLFVSPRTVEYHLRKIFAKLDITSRSQLHRVLADDRAS
ncbi:transcriptional regulator [Acrocarpospora corrugata]|uniref:Transcriptional regulator n=1 Tax=Acrocarpospora corrugata TaxID=35763 RepID=A0A5M3VXY8_9ACTN|nr:LuxR family transcriptional regulator [Acrocarpospora corrugata]GER99680.1 transcriptional regulator [Acrocarpospora corrugata]